MTLCEQLPNGGFLRLGGTILGVPIMRINCSIICSVLGSALGSRYFGKLPNLGASKSRIEA